MIKSPNDVLGELSKADQELLSKLLAVEKKHLHHSSEISSSPAHSKRVQEELRAVLEREVTDAN